VTSYSSKIINNAISSLNAQQAVIATTGNNIANVNTPGYARRVITLASRVSEGRAGGIQVGNGVEATVLTRIVDTFIDRLQRESISDKFAAEAEDSYIDRAQGLFALDDLTQTIGKTLNTFYSTLNDLTEDPASIPLRSAVLEAGRNLVSSISNTYNTVADLQAEIDQRIALEIDNVNNLTAQIAALNARVGQQEGAGQVAADDRDQRDVLVLKLAEKLSFTTRDEQDGSLTISLDNGLDLVFGNSSRNLDVTSTPSFGGPIQKLDGSNINFITLNFGDAGNRADVDLTNIIAANEGLIAGMLRTRGLADAANDTSALDANGFLVEVASRVEALTRDLLTTFNTSYLGPDEDGVTVGHQPSSADLNGNTPSVYGFFDFTFGGTLDDDGNGLPDDLGNHTGVDAYSSLLKVAIANPDQIAAALDQDPVAGMTSFISGDGSNIEALVALQSQSTTFSAGNYSQTGTAGEIYNQLVGYVGNQKARAESAANIADQSFIAASNRRDSVSAVSLDEEFTNLIRFQQAYAANARLIKVAEELLDQILNLL